MNLNNLNEYQLLTGKTANQSRDVHIHTVFSRDKEDRIINYVLGLAGESAEVMEYMTDCFVLTESTFDLAKLHEELGDVLWYVARIGSELGVKLDEIVKMKQGKNVHRGKKWDNNTGLLVARAGNVTDHIKKHIYHGHKLDIDKVVCWLSEITYRIDKIANATETPGIVYDLQHIAALNIEKTHGRYPEGFDIARSINRQE